MLSPPQTTRVPLERNDRPSTTDSPTNLTGWQVAQRSFPPRAS